MPAPTTAPIPVMLSRHTPNLPDGYGSHIGWNPGEPCRVLSRRGHPTVSATHTNAEMMWHVDAPEIDSCRGRGRWIYEVVLDGELSPCAIPADQILLP